MWKLERPANPADNAYKVSIQGVAKRSLRKRLMANQPKIPAIDNLYDKMAARNLFHKVPRTDKFGSVKAEEMKWVYKQRFSRKGARGRKIYDAIISAAPQGRCPLCGQRQVATLDHYLPQSHYPFLTVLPNNLIPSCSDCNHSKGDHYPATEGEASLHPYYDDVDGDTWLVASVIPSSPPALLFSVIAPGQWAELLSARVNRHFELFGLASLYASEAANELLNIRHQLKQIHDACGVDGVRRELFSRALSCSKVKRNSWRTAAFSAWAANDWFCDLGFYLM